MRTAHAIEARMAHLFQRCPELSGFSLQGGEALEVVEVALQAGYADVNEVRDEIVAALFELLDERPEAFALLRGRTFARVLH